MAGKVKRKDGEKLDDANIESVIALLEQAKPITQKEACERLNISVNGTRLKKIIQEYHDRKAEDKRRRAANRGKPVSEYEKSTIIEQYLVGTVVKSIADSLYRPIDTIKKVVEEVGVPQAGTGENYTNFGPLPEQCIAEQFEVGEYVWSAMYGSIAEIVKECGTNAIGSYIYHIYVHERIDVDKMLIDGKRFAFQPDKGGGFYAHQPAYDLGSLKHLLQYGVDVKRAIK